MAATAPQQLRPFDARMISVGDGHWLYVEEVGLKGGRPCVFLHGGPGSGCQHSHRNLFDPDRDHVFLFDQRGAGRSHPYLSRHANTTAHQIADIECIREHFGIDRWLVVGGSWGATLALAYAEAHPASVTGLVVRAVFLGTRREVQWAFVDGLRLFRPNLYDGFMTALTDAERRDPLAAYIARLTDPNPAVSTPAAHIWNLCERAMSELKPAHWQWPETFSTESRVPPTALMEAHYIAHDFYLEPDQLIRDAAKLKGIPGTIIQGRYDLLCPPLNAEALHQAWPGSKLQIIEAAGHAISEPGVFEAVSTAIAEI